jgi:transcriptional regulator
MVKTHVFTEAESLEMYKFRKEGKTYQWIADQIKYSDAGVINVIKKIDKYGTARNLFQSCRKRCTTKRTDHRIASIVSKSRKITVKEVKQELKSGDINCSESTIKRRLREKNFRRNCTQKTGH